MWAVFQWLRAKAFPAVPTDPNPNKPPQLVTGFLPAKDPENTKIYLGVLTAHARVVSVLLPSRPEA
jgi:hypothetical protein